MQMHLEFALSLKAKICNTILPRPLSKPWHQSSTSHWSTSSRPSIIPAKRLPTGRHSRIAKSRNAPSSYCRGRITRASRRSPCRQPLCIWQRNAALKSWCCAQKAMRFRRRSWKKLAPLRPRPAARSPKRLTVRPPCKVRMCSTPKNGARRRTMVTRQLMLRCVPTSRLVRA